MLCGLDEKAALLDSGDAAFFTTAHYDGYGSISVAAEGAEAAHHLSSPLSRLIRIMSWRSPSGATNASRWRPSSENPTLR